MIFRKTLSTLTILSILLSLSLFSCIDYKEVEVKEVSNIRVKKFTTENIQIEVTMKISNPNNYKISVVDSDLELHIKSKKIGAANIKGKIVLPKKSVENHKIVIETGLADMLSGAIPVLVGLVFDQSIELEINGNIKARAKSLSKTFPVNFKDRVEL